ncbi:hypothetical protein GUITHDRAFT_155898 [Guillardia theta CCMP2712]|uniref:LysM domain-containing protein n=1 Tax=Guillardia theta (strain CCMP2712) TaxID=905079 RepID=L1IDG1_GUITC|nr:hypothetical protein GUITHDRAFT_155898 [Guillardia theta CCMP2712]EKX33954.1 hypothetical protein GUITHDRAFT_155898 [Guillardia theta CCMP2712]|eukprot:XP_005820934.1 hypothetical protein GUITHDRAFT_155898 [Guillardia theta CCMP2712]
MSFLWTPCEADVGVYVICAQLVDSLSGGGGRTQCTSVTVGRAPAPYTEALPVQVATMGEEQRIVFTVARQDQGFAEYYRLPSIRLSRILGNVPSRVGNLTTFEPLHPVVEMRVNGATTMTLSNVSVFENKTRLDGSRYSFQGLYNGSIVWTPSHQLSGWQGAMCLTTCVYPLTCRGWSRERRAECSEYCIPVRVERCKWYVSRAQTYTEIAGLFSTSSLLLWYMNPVRQSSLHYDNFQSLTPGYNFMIYPGETINVGRKYLSEYENIFDVAQYFGMSTSDILRMNVDLNSSVLNSDKQLNQDLCIVPNVCVML